MTKDQFTIGESSFVRLEACGGDLVVRGWAESTLQIKGEYRIEETDKGYTIESNGDLTLSLPRDVFLSIGRVRGDLVVKQFTGTTSCEYVQGDAVISQAGDINLGIIHGDLVIRNLIGTVSADEVNGDVSGRVLGGATFGAIHGDLSARVIDGDFIIKTINGDADLRTINGDVIVNQGFRDINLIGIGGLVTVTGVTGDIRLRGGLTPGDHNLEARGDIVVRWPAGLALNLVASAAQIDNRLMLDEKTEKPGTLTGCIGQGGANLTLSTSGRVILREQEPNDEKWNKYKGEMEFEYGFDMSGIAARIEAEVNTNLSRVIRDLESRFGEEFGQRSNDKVARKVEKASERARRRAETRDRAPNSDFSSPAATTAKKPATSEEQLHILKMVETGKISPQEAGMLLEALEA